jgi:AcrR family transcriptional regulator
VPRIKTLSDRTLLDGALAVMRRHGPGGVTFQSVAAEVGLSASTLVQRFGSKPALLRAALLCAWDQLEARTVRANASAPMTAAGAIAMLVSLSADYGEGDDYAEGLLVLREDLRDPVLRQRGTAWLEGLAVSLGRRLGGDGHPRPDLGRLMVAQWQGIVLAWGFTRRGKLPRAVAVGLRTWMKAVGVI